MVAFPTAGCNKNYSPLSPTTLHRLLGCSKTRCRCELSLLPIAAKKVCRRQQRSPSSGCSKPERRWYLSWCRLKQIAEPVVASAPVAVTSIPHRLQLLISQYHQLPPVVTIFLAVGCSTIASITVDDRIACIRRPWRRSRSPCVVFQCLCNTTTAICSRHALPSPYNITTSPPPWIKNAHQEQ